MGATRAKGMKLMAAEVVVGIDGSAVSRAALREAVTQAAWRNARLRMLNVVHFPAAMGFDAMIDLETLRVAGQAVLDDELAKLEAEYPDGLPVEVITDVRLGHTGGELITIGDEEGIDVVLTVVGSRGFGGFRGLIVGSVTTYLVHHLEGPLLIVPPVATVS